MSLACSRCQIPLMQGMCPECGWSKPTQPNEPAMEKKGRSYFESHRCDFRTGVWQCQWGVYLRRPRDPAFCDLHQQGIQAGISDTRGMLDILLARRRFIQTHYTLEAFLDAEGLQDWRTHRAPERLKHLPFYWQPLDECWRILTGLPLPEGIDEIVQQDEEAHHGQTVTHPDVSETEGS